MVLATPTTPCVPGVVRTRGPSAYAPRRPEETVLYSVVREQLETSLARARERLLAFSCKGRGFCPSCGGRRMADTAAHLVDRVIPEVPVRQ